MVPEEAKEYAQQLKQIQDDRAIYEERLKKEVEDRIPEEHRENYRTAMTLYKDPNAMKGMALEKAEGYIPD